MQARETPSSPLPCPDDVLNALDYLVSIEPDPDAFDDIDSYRAFMSSHALGIARAEAALRRFGEHLALLGLPEMQKAYYGITNHPRYLGSAVDSGVVVSALNSAWDGVGPWRG